MEPASSITPETVPLLKMFEPGPIPNDGTDSKVPWLVIFEFPVTNPPLAKRFKLASQSMKRVLCSVTVNLWVSSLRDPLLLKIAGGNRRLIFAGAYHGSERHRCAHSELAHAIARCISKGRQSLYGWKPVFAALVVVAQLHAEVVAGNRHDLGVVYEGAVVNHAGRRAVIDEPAMSPAEVETQLHSLPGP